MVESAGEQSHKVSNSTVHLQPIGMYSMFSGVRCCGNGLAKVQVEAVKTGADAVVGSLHQVQTRATGGTLIAATADARLAQRRALLTALLVVPKKPRRTLGNTRPERHTRRRWKGKDRHRQEEPHETRKINIWQS